MRFEQIWIGKSGLFTVEYMKSVRLKRFFSIEKKIGESINLIL